jgi:SAM-dependent methyltransferase
MLAEQIPREAAADPLPFTGERLTSALSGQTQIEHYHRYLFARSLARGRDVLDVAAGEGYGTALLAQVARRTVGVEFDGAAVRSAGANFTRSNLVFVQGDARAMPLADAAFDLVVSFETIEHFDRQATFVAEVRRVLRAGGCFIVSTPDRDVYAAPGQPPNPFHVQEMNRPEFIALLRDHFPVVSVLAQRPVIGSVLLPDDPPALPPLVFERNRDAFTATDALPHAPYLVAVASDRPLPPLPPSLFIERSDLDSDALALAQRTHELLACRQQAEAAIARLSLELVQARSSLRGFLKQYLPRLRRHLLRR